MPIQITEDELKVKISERFVIFKNDLIFNLSDDFNSLNIEDDSELIRLIKEVM